MSELVHTWTDEDGDLFKIRRHPDGALSTIVRETDDQGATHNVGVAYLSRAQALELYHLLGDHLIATEPPAEPVGHLPADRLPAPDKGDPRQVATPTCCSGEDTSTCCPGPDYLPDATADGYDWTGPEQPESIAQEAHRLVFGDREDAYEHPRKGFTRTAIVWQAILMDKLADGESISPQDVVLCMAGIKLAREAGNPKRDNRVDMAGYAICLDRLETGQ